MIKIKEYFIGPGLWLKKIVSLGLILVLFAPLIVYNDSYFPFVFGRNIFFRLIIDIIFPLYIYGVISKVYDWPKFNKATVFFILFILVLTISSIFGGNFLFSFWSNFERMDGLVNWYHILMYVVVLIGANTQQRDWHILFKTSLLVAWVVSLYALGQSLHLSFLIPSSGGQRLASLFGNAAYVGSYLFLHVVLAIYFLFSLYSEKKVWSFSFFYYLLSVILFIVILMATETRGAFVGLAVFIFSFLIFYLVHFRKKRSRFYYWVLSFLLVGVVFIILIFVQKDSAWVKNIPIFSRISNISLNDTTTQSRLMIWRNSLYAWQEKPILGWGEENFTYAFNKYFPTEIFHTIGSEVWYDRPHNILIQHLVQGGIIGLIFYLAIFIYLIIILHQRAKEQRNWAQSMLWLSFLLGFLVQDFFIFDNLNVNVVFYLILSYLMAERWQSDDLKNKLLQLLENWRNSILARRLRLYWRAFIMFLLSVSLLYFMVWKPWQSNIIFLRIFLEAPQAKDVAGLEKVKADWLKSYYLVPLGEKEKTAGLNDILGLVLGNPSATDDMRFKFINLTGQYLELNYQKYPRDIRSGMYLSSFYQFVGTFDPSFIDQDIELLNNMASLAPRRLEIKFALVLDYIRKGDLDKAKEQALLSRDLAPHSKAVYWQLANVYWKTKEYKEFNTAVLKVRDWNIARHQEEFDAAEKIDLNNFLQEAKKSKDKELIDLVSGYLQ